MESKVVLITGASKGIGKAMARLFAHNGYKVIIVYNNSELEAQNLANELCSNGFTAVCLKANIANETEIKNMFEQSIDIFGHIDVLINNAGISSHNILMDETSSSIDSLISTNLTGTINCCKYVYKHFISRGKGKIINISSIWGVCGASNESIYSATKGGIIAFSKALAKELAYSGITVNCIAPRNVIKLDKGKMCEIAEKLKI